jgi:2,3-bisphosphoglycerate-independent phosphoglycerate mutase
VDEGRRDHGRHADLALTSGKLRARRINYANGDMVGHTGHRDAAITAVQVVDLCLARLLPVIDASSRAR